MSRSTGRSAAPATVGLPWGAIHAEPSESRSPARPYREDSLRSSATLDFAILRECAGPATSPFGFDPRTSPEAIARRLKVSPATVRRHLARWRAQGFHLGYDVLPHPDILGSRLASRLLEFPNARAQENAIEALGLIDGVVQIVPARLTLFVAYYVDSDAQAERRSAQLRAIPGTTSVGPEMAFDFRPCTRRMSGADWRLVRVLRRHPEASVAELALATGQSARTTSRRYDALIDDEALMFDPVLDFSRFCQTLAVLVADVEHRASAGEIRRAIVALYPDSIEASGPSTPDPARESGTVQLWVTAATAGRLDELAGQVSHIPGVTNVLLWHGRSILPVRPWLDDRIDSIVRLGESSRRAN
jgi:DNA-binding Lrp family transcriptional regulator